MGDNYEKLKKYVDVRKVYDKEGYNIACNNKLTWHIKKKMTTMMIGIIEQFEKHFGDLWGQGLKDDECTDEQLDDKVLWKKCRERILDIGNTQIRGMEKELKEYIVEMVRHKIDFKKGK